MEIPTIPNLDACVCPEELESFRLEMAQTAVVFYDLSAYATIKREAMKHRLAGRIDKAVSHEEDCQRLYERLPEWARW